MCAMMPMLRVRLSGVWRGIANVPIRSSISVVLPAVMREGLIRFRHPVRVFALLYRAAAQVGRIQQLVGQLLLHRLAVTTRPGESDQPSDAERQSAIGIHFDGYLIVRPADAARLHLETWLDVVERLLEHL